MEQIKLYIISERQKGIIDPKIKIALLEAGWQESLIDTALDNADNVPTPQPASNNEKAALHNRGVTNIGIWDAFEHLLLFVSLYLMALAITFILHYLVDKWLPGVATNGYGGAMATWQQGTLRIFLSILIISVPLFSFLFLDITKRTILNPSIRNLRERKLLIYLTLFGTFLFIFINSITAVYNLLNGNVTLNFIVRLLVTLTVNGIIFAYYLTQVKEDRKLNA